MAVTSDVHITDHHPLLAEALIGSTPASGTATPIPVVLHGAGHTLNADSLTVPGTDSGHGPGPDPATVYDIGLPPPKALEGLSDESRQCLERFAVFKAAPPIDTGLARTAAVLIALYQRPGEDMLRVLLTTRARHLRRNPGQTALPGGKVDPEDPSVVYTARREAHEEVGLPASHPDIYTVAVLDPLLTVLPMGAHTRNHIVVTSVVAFIADPRIVDTLHGNPDEVDVVFDHPFSAIHSGVVPTADVERLSEEGGEWWPAEFQKLGGFHNLEDRVGSTGAYRMHRFRTTHSPVRGFTSDVLISAATIGYGSEPVYGHRAHGQLLPAAMIERVVAELPEALKEVPDPTKPKPVIEWGRSDGTTFKSGETYYAQT